ncbi:hypothetical protein LCGC14_2525160 [marine sediment metagenome]|uniref:Uncharacterized protein n=1 Tax=marine sediment metagenome TaxID=412755 RepID=A0A0F9BI33_9ZZZZ
MIGIGTKTPYGTVVGIWPLVAGWILLEVAYAPCKTIMVRVQPSGSVS